MTGRVANPLEGFWVAHPFALYRRVRPLNFPHRPESVTYWKIVAYQFVVDKFVNPCYRRLCYFKQASLLPSAAPALTLAPSIACSLFPIAKKVNSFGIKQIQPLFPKHPGWGGYPECFYGTPGMGYTLASRPRGISKSYALLCVGSAPSASQRYPGSAHCLMKGATTFKINTCKSVSKQTTLTPFIINTYAKQGEGVGDRLIRSILRIARGCHPTGPAELRSYRRQPARWGECILGSQILLHA